MPDFTVHQHSIAASHYEIGTELQTTVTDLDFWIGATESREAGDAYFGPLIIFSGMGTLFTRVPTCCTYEYWRMYLLLYRQTCAYEYIVRARKCPRTYGVRAHRYESSFIITSIIGRRMILSILANNQLSI